MRRARLALLVLAWLLPVATPALPGPADVIAVNVLLEPDRTLRDVAVRANTRLRATDPSGFAFDDDHAPHLTLVQAYIARGDLPRVLAAVDQVLARNRPTDADLTATGISLAPWQGRVLASIRVSPTAWLVECQAQLVDAMAPFLAADGGASAFVPAADGSPVEPEIVGYVRDFVPKQTGRGFNPHVTVGIAGKAGAARLAAEPFTPVSFRAAAVSVYQIGEFGTARRKLWTQGDGAQQP